MSAAKRRAVDMMAMSADHDQTAGYVPSAVAVVPVVPVVSEEEPVAMAGMQDLHEGQAQQAEAVVGGTAEDHQQIPQQEQAEIVPRGSGRVRRASVVRQPPEEADQQQRCQQRSCPHPHSQQDSKGKGEGQRKGEGAYEAKATWRRGELVVG